MDEIKFEIHARDIREELYKWYVKAKLLSYIITAIDFMEKEKGYLETLAKNIETEFNIVGPELDAKTQEDIMNIIDIINETAKTLKKAQEIIKTTLR
ncbi:MAG TPA: hypothetical protein ENG01_00935 [Candidatus Aenigmarchaeota archaeon]|nr:hypothetical protein [Candidatus Aenigmarchaeota archaeon]HEX32960.1 hypothetical protein [Candidatus Aenigmarchaeota archaeon]